MIQLTSLQLQVFAIATVGLCLQEVQKSRRHV